MDGWVWWVWYKNKSWRAAEWNGGFQSVRTGLVNWVLLFIASKRNTHRMPLFKSREHVYTASLPPIVSIATKCPVIPNHSIPPLAPLHHHHHLLRSHLRPQLRLHSLPNNRSPKRHHRHADALQQRHRRPRTPIQQPPPLLLLLRAQPLLYRECRSQRHPLLHPTAARSAHLRLPRLQPDPTLLRQRHRRHLQHPIPRRQQRR